MRVMIKHFLILFLPLAVLLGVVLLVFYWVVSGAERKIMEADEVRVLDLQREVITHDFRSVVSDLLFLAEQDEVKNILENSKTRGLVGEMWLSFSRRKGSYDQIRFLDETGMERVRVNYNDGNPVSIPDEQLQLKKNRYYFQDTFKLNREDVFVSPFDLNIEHGEIEQPLKPMIRFGTPVFDSGGKKRGILLLNYLGAHMISDFEHLSFGSLGQNMLLNSDGFWLNGPDAEQEWGFMYEDGGNRTFANSFPDVWKRISGEHSGVIYNAGGLFSFQTLHPFFEGVWSSSGSGKPFKSSTRRIEAGKYSWKIVSYVPREVLYTRSRKIFNRFIALYIIIIILLAGGAWFLTCANRQKKKAEENLKLFRVLIDQSNDGIFVINPETGGFIDVNNRACSSTGYRREELLSMKVGDIDAVIPDKSAWDAHVAEVKKKGYMVLEGKCKRKDDTVFPTEVNVNYAVHGEKAYMIAVVRDFTERKKAAEEIRRLAEQLKRATEGAHVALWEGQIVPGVDWKSPETILIMSSIATEMLGYSVDEWKHTISFWMERMHPDDRAGVMGALIAHIEKKTGGYSVDYRLQHTKGHYIWLHTEGQAEWDNNGNVFRMSGAWIDITERKKMEEERESMSRQLIQSEKLASIGEIAAGIAHELNTPLNVILGYQEIMQKKIESGSPFEEYVRISIEEIEFCSSLIKDFLFYARPSDPDKLKESISIPDLVRDVLRMFVSSMIRNIHIKYNIDKEIPHIQGNHKQMMQVFINLINNALQAMPDGGEIMISAKQVKGDTVEFRISDTGEGVPEENINKVFVPFFTTKRPGKGTGLGLAVCVRIMENHKGTLRIESKLGEGTTIIGQLPVRRPG